MSTSKSGDHKKNKGKGKAKHEWSTEENLEPLSGKPYFYVRLTKSALKPYFIMVVPRDGQDILPSCRAHISLTRHDILWYVWYIGSNVQKRFDTLGWTGFATANQLCVNDFLLFELMEVPPPVLKVRVIRGEIPTEFLHDHEEDVDGTEDMPIVID